MISIFCHEVDENCALLGYHAASGGCPVTLVRNYHYSLCNSPQECSSQFLFVPARNYFEQQIT
jgi:hypothetical protein